MDCRNVASGFLLSVSPVVVPSGSLWLMSNSPKHLLLAEVITSNIPVNRMARKLEENIGECAGGV
jgi:hypothetical protein